MKIQTVFSMLAICLAACGAWPATAAEVELDGYRFTIPDGMQIERVAEPPLVNRPICADFDEQGRLYVADSSGSNDNVQIQLEKLPHRIVRLEDTDGDGRFDNSVVFADRMMFPEGTLWHNGSLYVGAPPHIWKLTDTDDDGRADLREIWFDGKTLTHCGNDMHGPFLGPDGWFYWCKGAFAEQTYERPGRDPLVTRAAHIFRRHPSGGAIEPVMTGGMDNPVEVVFTPGGERIFTTTFLVHPAHGQRDGIIHAIYGGVYGKDHRVLEGHLRTGPLMPVLAHHGGASAPCGLARLESNQLGDDYQNNVLACSFNMHKIIRHQLQPSGASFTSSDSDLISSTHIDFHPTDVLEDADGSLLVLDTGGWYKLCCPTAQLWKPDVLGGIYRLRRAGAHKIADARGRKLDWPSLNNERLIELLADERFAVRNRARQMLGRRGAPVAPALRRVLEQSNDRQQRLHAVWSLTQIDDASARSAIRLALNDKNENVRQAALHSISLHRDKSAQPQLVDVLQSRSAPNRRAAAEALGRIGADSAIGDLLAATAESDDRALGHSAIYGAIEIGRPAPVRAALRHKSPRVRSAALIALDQMPAGDLAAEDITPLLASESVVLRDTAWWIADHRPQFAEELAGYFQQQFATSHDTESLALLKQRLARFAADDSIQQLMAQNLSNDTVDRDTRLAVVQAMGASGLKTLPTGWEAPLGRQLTDADAEVLQAAVAAVHALSQAKPSAAMAERLAAVAANEDRPAHVRLQALGALGKQRRVLDSSTLEFLGDNLAADRPVNVRSLSVDVLTGAKLDQRQLQQVAAALVDTGPMELRRLMEIFANSKDEQVGAALVEALERCPAAVSLSVETLQQQLAGFGDALAGKAEPLLAKIRQENAAKIAKIDDVLALVPSGDIRRGQQVFHSSQSACINCHGMGYLGGRVGPDLTRIGRIRTERDLLESILFPSASLVRTYEPTQIITTRGKIYSGVVTDETEAEIVLQLDAEKVVRIPQDDVEERLPGKVSIMPEGLEKHFSPRQLADLIAFLKASK